MFKYAVWSPSSDLSWREIFLRFCSRLNWSVLSYRMISISLVVRICRMSKSTFSWSRLTQIRFVILIYLLRSSELILLSRNTRVSDSRSVLMEILVESVMRTGHFERTVDTIFQLMDDLKSFFHDNHKTIPNCKTFCSSWMTWKLMSMTTRRRSLIVKISSSFRAPQT